MFAIVHNGAVQKLIQQGQSFSYNNVDYPSTWTSVFTQEQKDELGIVDVVYEERPNDKFYWVSEKTPVYDVTKNQVIVEFNRFPKDVAQLKSTLTSQIKDQAWSILQSSDWMVIRATETGEPMPQEWKTWRQEIRTQARSNQDAVEACLTADELAALPAIQWAKDPSNID
jgi:hypothetical protein